MSLNKLSISYRCHNSIGNSLDINVMMSEVIKTFIVETDAIHGSFYILEEDSSCTKIVSIGKKISLDLFLIKSRLENNEILIEKYNEKINVLIYKLEKRVYVFCI